MNLWFRKSAIQDGHDLPPGTDIVRGEGGRGGPGGHTLLLRPLEGGGVILTAAHGSGGLGTAFSPPEESQDLAVGAGLVRAERGGAGTGGNAVLHGPLSSKR